MSIRNQQIGWSQESKLWWEVLKKFNQLETTISSQFGRATHTPPAQIGWRNEEYLLREIAKKVGEITSLRCSQDSCITTTTTSSSSTTTTTTTAVPLGLRLLWDDIANAPVSPFADVADWNAFFDLPANGTPFTSVEVVGNEVRLYGGSGITLKNDLFNGNINLLEINDESGCIITADEKTFSTSSNLTTVSLPNLTTAGNRCFASCTLLTSISFPALETVGGNCFEYCTSLSTVNLPLLTTVGDQCFFNCTSLTSVYLPSCTNLGTTVGDNNVFFGITGQTITVIVPDALLTCNGGNPDGDLQYLIANNTVLFPLKLVGVEDHGTVLDWNTFFDLPNYGTPFTSVYYVSGSPSITYLFGGLGITLRADLFNGSTIEQILDNQSNCIIAAGVKSLSNSNLQTVDLPSVATIGNSCFGNCTLLEYLSIPVCTAIGDDCNNNNVFDNINLHTISLIVSPYVMDCGGSHIPDGDITTLISNNTVSIPLVLKFNGSYPVVDPTDVTQWNTLFDLPTLGTEFTSVTVDGNNVYLYGGANIILQEIVDWKANLVEIIDAAGCIIALDTNCFKGAKVTTAYLLGVTYTNNSVFQGCVILVTAYLDKVTTIGGSGFLQCTSIETIYIPSCTNLGGSCGDNAVFTYITGATITLTVSNSLATTECCCIANCSSLFPPPIYTIDCDITYLQANNTVTLIGV